MNANANVEVLTLTQKQRVSDLRHAALVTQLALPAALTSSVFAIRKPLWSPVEARADYPVVEYEYSADRRSPAVRARLNGCSHLHVVVIPLNLLDARQIARWIRVRDNLA
jgi:hypothetical protein